MDFLLTAKQDKAAARRFLQGAINLHGVPEKITIDNSGANTAAIESVKTDACVDILMRQNQGSHLIKYLADTNILGYFARNSSAALQKRMLTALKKQEIAISAITRAETRFGRAMLQADDKRRRTMDLLLNKIPVLPWTLEAADRHGEIAAHLQQTGQPIGEMDTQIAAHALALGLPLVAHNTRHFKRVAGLKLEDWMT